MNAAGQTPGALLRVGWYQDEAKIEKLAMREKSMADQNKVREKQKLLGDTYELLCQFENQGKQPNRA